MSQLVVCIGILAALVVNVALPATSWRTMFAIATVPAAVLAIGETHCLNNLTITQAQIYVPVCSTIEACLALAPPAALIAQRAGPTQVPWQLSSS